MIQKVCVKDIADYSKGQQINGDDLLDEGLYDYLNGGINPSGRWSEYNVEANTVTISEGGNSSGYINYMEKPFWCGAHCYYLYNVKGNAKYLYFALKSQQDRLMGIRSGACMPNIKKADLGNFMFLYDAEIATQKRVIDTLEAIEKVIAIRKKQLEQLDLLIKARFVEMFGDTVTNPFGWEEHRLDEYIVFLTSGSRGWAKHFVDDENELFITIKNVKNNHITLDDIQHVNAPDNKEAERTKVKANDLLISITADLGRTGVVSKEIEEKGAYINQHLSLVRLDTTRIYPLYVSHYLETEGGKIQFESKNQNGVKAGLNFDAIKTLKLLVPPFDKQKEYLNFVAQVDKSKVAVQKSLDEAQLLFDSLMQKYFEASSVCVRNI